MTLSFADVAVIVVVGVAEERQKDVAAAIRVAKQLLDERRMKVLLAGRSLPEMFNEGIYRGKPRFASRRRSAQDFDETESSLVARRPKLQLPQQLVILRRPRRLHTKNSVSKLPSARRSTVLTTAAASWFSLPRGFTTSCYNCCCYKPRRLLNQ